MSKKLSSAPCWQAIALLFLMGCATSPKNESERLPLDLPPSFDTSAASRPFAGEACWQDFDDPRITDLVREALLQNFDLQAAAARMETAGAGQRMTGAAQYPSLGLNAGAGERNNMVELPGGILQRNTLEDYSIGLSLAWEIDLWGKVRNRTQAAIADFEAEQANYQALRFSLAANTIKSWFAAVEAELQLELAQETVRVFEHNLLVVESSFQRGIPDRALDVRLTRANLEGARGTLALRQRLRDTSGRSLETLLGRYPADSILVTTNLPQLIHEVPPGLPAELLERRPDLVAAERRLAGTLERAKVARKDLLPTISLTSSIGQRSTELRDLMDFEQLLWSVAGNLTQPVFQAGRIIAGIDLADANTRQALATYAQAVLEAFREVESFLAAEDYLKNQQEALEKAATESIAADQLAWQQYQRGLVDIITVLESQRRSFNAQSSLLSVTYERLANRVNLYLALGGDFGTTLPLEARNNTENP